MRLPASLSRAYDRPTGIGEKRSSRGGAYIRGWRLSIKLGFTNSRCSTFSLSRLAGRALGVGRRCGGCRGFLLRPVGLGRGGGVAVSATRRRVRIAWSGNFQVLAQRRFPLVSDVFGFLAKHASGCAALAHAFAIKADPRAALFEQTLFDAQVDQIAFPTNAFPVVNIEFAFA